MTKRLVLAPEFRPYTSRRMSLMPQIKPFGVRCISFAVAGTLLPLAFGTNAAAQLDAAAAASDRAGQTETPPPAPDVDEVIRQLTVTGRFVMVPVVGRIGIDVVPETFEALAARREFLNGATAFIVTIDSDSGGNAAAMRIAQALLEIGEKAPVIIVVQRAVGPAALLLPAAHRVFIAEPASSGVVISLQPEIDPMGDTSVDEGVAHFTHALESIIERSPRREALAPLVGSTAHWQLTAPQAYALRLVDPLEGGVDALGRTLRMNPWATSGRHVEELARRTTTYTQQLDAYRARLIARAFASLEAASAAAAQAAAVEQAAFAVDPRHATTPGSELRVQLDGGRWTATPESVAAWQRSCEAAIAAWQRVAALDTTAQQHLKTVESAIGSLVAIAARAPNDAVVAEAIDRVERERAAVAERVAELQVRARAALEEAAAIAALLGR